MIAIDPRAAMSTIVASVSGGKDSAAMCLYLRELGLTNVNAVGIRSGESASRSKMTEWEWSDTFDCWVWRPIINWTDQDVIDIHRRHDLAPNPLYLRGAERVGCWPCIFARKRDVRMVAEETPERVDQIARLEAELPASPAVPEKGLDEMPRTFFHGKITRKGIPLPIHDAVAWSQTQYGTKDQGVLFHDLGQPEGCVRWGLCEAVREEADAE